LTDAARILFLIGGGMWLLIGLLTPPLLDRNVGPPILFVSERTDTALFGADPREIRAVNPDLTTLRGIILRALAGLLVASGTLTLGVAWFGMREPETWALTLLTIVGLVVLPYWWVALEPYRAAGVGLRLSDIPPFMWVPAIVMPVAAALGWVDRLRG